MKRESSESRGVELQPRQTERARGLARFSAKCATGKAPQPVAAAQSSLDDMCCPTLALRTAEEAEHCAAVDAEDALSLSHAWV